MSFTKRAILGGLAALMLTAGAAMSGPGDPIPGRDIVLEGDPNSLVVATGRTDAKGTVTFLSLKKGRYTVAIPDTSAFPVGSGIGTTRSVQVTITANGKTVMAKPIPITPRSAKATATDKDGKNIVISLDKPGGTIAVTLTESLGLQEVPTTR